MTTRAVDDGLLVTAANAEKETSTMVSSLITFSNRSIADERRANIKLFERKRNQALNSPKSNLGGMHCAFANAKMEAITIK